MEYSKQVDSNHYGFERYFHPGRWMSYYYQVKEIVSRDDIHTALDIGPGTSFLRDVLAVHRPEISYKTADIAEDVQPDFVGGVTQLPVEDKKFDVVCAFQVLEHIEYRDVETALAELARVSNKYVFISIPHFGPALQLMFKIPFFPKIRFAFRIPFPKKHIFNGQHYWELGKRGYPPSKFRQLVSVHFEVLNEYVPFEYQYHRFFLLQKK